MYQYQPIANKKQIYWKCALSAFLGCSCFGISSIQNIPVPSVWQLASLICFAAFVLLVSGGLLKSYLYQVETTSDVPEFIITEYFGRRISTVCRVSLNDIIEILPADRKTRATCEKIGVLYVYAVPTPLEKRSILKMQCADKIFFVEIVSDEGFFNIVKTYKKQ